jgi:hypothetical protein
VSVVPVAGSSAVLMLSWIVALHLFRASRQQFSSRPAAALSLTELAASLFKKKLLSVAGPSVFTSPINGTHRHALYVETGLLINDCFSANQNNLL